MSTFERYDLTSGSYDSTRVPVGTEIIAGCLTMAGLPLHQLSLLDAGCGTGAYSAALVDHVGRITGLDLSDGMLQVAQAKLAPWIERGTAELRKGSITAMPFAEASFDAVMFNQVLHHLEDGKDPEFAQLSVAVAEAYRVLKPGGLAVINACTHKQLRKGYWYYRLIPEALNATLARCAPAPAMVAALDSAGFEFHDRIVPHESVMQGQSYFDGRGPLDEGWRQGDSIWALATPAERQAAERQIQVRDEAGTLDAFVVESDAERPIYGQFSFFLARRPARAASDQVEPSGST